MEKEGTETYKLKDKKTEDYAQDVYIWEMT